MARIAFAASAATALIATAAVGQPRDVVPPSGLQWRTMIPGVEFASAYGDWEKEAHGKFIRLAPGTKVPMHTHSAAYRGVMLSGRMVNLSAKDSPVTVEPGTYFDMAGARPHGHECVSEDSCLFYTHSDAVWDLQLVDE